MPYKKIRFVKLYAIYISALAISACGDSSTVNAAKDIQEAVAAAKKMSEFVETLDSFEVGSGGASAAQLVTEHNIHWSNAFFFPAETLDGKTGVEAMWFAYEKLKAAAANEAVDKQIRECHQQVSSLRLLSHFYKSDESQLRLFDEEVAKAEKAVENAAYYGSYLSRDIAMKLNYIGLLKQYDTALSEAQVKEVNNAFWQWCVELPEKHFMSGTQHPIKI